jgi:uncharacterized cupredoxin-like copper-binding protein
MRLLVPALLIALAAGMSPAGAADSTIVGIDLSNFRFAPSTVTLKSGQPYVLHIVNKASGGHDLVAKAFFAAATIAPADRKLVSHGEVELDGGETVDVHLTAPAAGKYEMHCSHFMHSTFGMTGSIVVE